MHSLAARFHQLEGCGLWVPEDGPEPEPAPARPPATAEPDEDLNALVDEVVVDLRVVRRVMGLGRFLCGALTVLALSLTVPVAGLDLFAARPAGRVAAPARAAARPPPDAAAVLALERFSEESRRARRTLQLALVLLPADLDVADLELSTAPAAPARLPALTVAVNAQSEKPESALTFAASLEALLGSAAATPCSTAPLEPGAVTPFTITARQDGGPWPVEPAR